MIINPIILKRDTRDARPLGLTSLRADNCGGDCDPTGDCATSCSDCESSSEASCGTCEERR